MTAQQLKCLVETHGVSPFFFAKTTMSFFRDTMRNFGVRETIIFDQKKAHEVEVYELYRKQPVKYGLQSSHFFDRNTFREVTP